MGETNETYTRYKLSNLILSLLRDGLDGGSDELQQFYHYAETAFKLDTAYALAPVFYIPPTDDLPPVLLDQVETRAIVCARFHRDPQLFP